MQYGEILKLNGFKLEKEENNSCFTLATKAQRDAQCT